MSQAIPGVTSTGGLPVSPSMGPTLESARIQRHSPIIDGRVLRLCLIAIAISFVTTGVAFLLVKLIALITNLTFWGSFSFSDAAPSTERFGALTILAPVAGGLLVGLMARFGSPAIRGHGIPEAMEQVLTNQSRIPIRMTFLKPLSSAISIGTGGPFGAEGPIIATGGALGSVVGQVLKITAAERKTLLGAGAAAGMTAIFGTPFSAVLLAIELLLFEYRVRSLIPVCLATITAAGARVAFFGTEPAFSMRPPEPLTELALVNFLLEGALIGAAAFLVTKLVYWIEDGFERLPIHWMWWPALGGIVVGGVGYFFPATLGVGYSNIETLISGQTSLKFALFFGLAKLLSWSIALGSGTSGGTLAPLLSIGGCAGLILGALANRFGLPHVDIGVAALVGAAAMFAGASRALLASVVFAVEATHQYAGLFPLLAGCTSSFLVSCLLMRNSIMTEKIVRRGVSVPVEYAPDYLGQLPVRDFMSGAIVTLSSKLTVEDVHKLLHSAPERYPHQGFPVLADDGVTLGVVTRRDLLTPETRKTLGEIVQRPPLFISEMASLRDAADMMASARVGRLLVRTESERRVTGIITRSDLLRAHEKRIREVSEEKRHLSIGALRERGKRGED